MQSINQEEVGPPANISPHEIFPGSRHLQIIADSWVQAKFILLHPYQFYDNVPLNVSYKQPAKFLVIAMGVHCLFQMLIERDLIEPVFGGLEQLVYIGILSAAAFGAARFLGGKGSLLATFNVLAYAHATWFFTGIPWLAFFGVYTLFLFIVGIKKIHALSLLKSSALVACLMGIVLLIVGAGSGSLHL